MNQLNIIPTDTNALLKRRGDLIWAVWQELMMMQKQRTRMHNISAQSVAFASQLTLKTMNSALMDAEDLSGLSKYPHTEMSRQLAELTASVNWCATRMTDIMQQIDRAEQKFGELMTELGQVHFALGGRAFSADRRIENILYRIKIEGGHAILTRPDLEDEAPQEDEDDSE